MSQNIDWSWIRQIFEYNEDEMERVRKSPQHLKWIKAFPQIRNVRMIAEIVESKNCMAQLRKGDKYYFKWGGYVLDTSEGAKNVCLWAVSQLLPFYFMINDRVAEGLDPNGMIVNHVRCFDVGFRGNCGYGEVLMKVYAERKNRY